MRQVAVEFRELSELSEYVKEIVDGIHKMEIEGKGPSVLTLSQASYRRER